MPVTLRHYREADAEEVWTAARESVVEVSPWMQWCHDGYTVADAAAWIARSIAGHRDGRMFEFAIVDEHGTFVGSCGIRNVDRIDGFATVSYWIRTSRAGRGYATSAVSQLLKWGFANSDLHRLEFVVAEGNTRSARVAENVGAEREGLLRHRLIHKGRLVNAHLYSVLRFDRVPGRTAG